MTTPMSIPRVLIDDPDKIYVPIPELNASVYEKIATSGSASIARSHTRMCTVTYLTWKEKNTSIVPGSLMRGFVAADKAMKIANSVPDQFICVDSEDPNGLTVQRLVVPPGHTAFVNFWFSTQGLSHSITKSCSAGTMGNTENTILPVTTFDMKDPKQNPWRARLSGESAASSAGSKATIKAASKAGSGLKGHSRQPSIVTALERALDESWDQYEEVSSDPSGPVHAAQWSGKSSITPVTGPAADIKEMLSKIWASIPSPKDNRKPDEKWRTHKKRLSTSLTSDRTWE